jgi:hypothetical protein
LDTFKTLNDSVTDSDEKLISQVTDMIKEHQMGLKMNFRAYFQMWTLTWNGFENPLNLIISVYHQVKKIALLA